MLYIYDFRTQCIFRLFFIKKTFTDTKTTQDKKMKCYFLARWKKRSLKNSIEHFSWVWGWKCVRLQLSQKVLTSLGLSSYSSSLIVEPHSVAKGQASSRKGRPSSLRSVLSVNKVIPPLLCTLASCTAMLWANLDFKESKKLV